MKSLRFVGSFVLLCVCSCRSRQPAPPPLAPATEARDASVPERVEGRDAMMDDARTDGARSDDGGRGDAQPSWAVSAYRSEGGVEFYSFAESAFVSVGAGSREAPRSAPRFDAPAPRSGRAPAMAAVLAAVRATVASGATFAPQGRFNALGDGRFVLVLQRTDRGFPRSPSLDVVVASESAEGGRAQIEGMAEVPTTDVFQGDVGNGCDLSVEGRELRDIDGDGELELAMSVRYCSQPVCPTGFSEFEYLAVYDLTPAPRLVAFVERKVLGQSDIRGLRARRTRWRDVNNDGHADLIAEGEDCGWVGSEAIEGRAPAELGCARFHTVEFEGSPPSLCCVRRSETVLYDPATDQWRAGGDGACPAEELPCSHGD